VESCLKSLAKVMASTPTQSISFINLVNYGIGLSSLL
jgi:hypothetical protein